uniref:GAG-pre-integrase domain-containing protein n=1 Tax=Vitis vinifera TaxID=29760 RepID=A5CA69_VITVI|nr:hypothetical protein VITISV_004557 [Vitis vinifera]
MDKDKDVDMDEVEEEDMVVIEVVANLIVLIVVVLKVKKNNSNHQKWNNSKAQPEKGIKPQSKHARENKCHRYGPVDLIQGSRRTTIILPSGTKIYINDALYSVKSKQNLLSFKDIRRNGYHIVTMNDGSNKYIFITLVILGKKHILEKLISYSYGLYRTITRLIESYAVMNQKFCDLKTFMIWHERLGHPGLSMMCRIINSSFGHPLKNQKILMPNDYNCVVCS